MKRKPFIITVSLTVDVHELQPLNEKAAFNMPSAKIEAHLMEILPQLLDDTGLEVLSVDVPKQYRVRLNPADNTAQPDQRVDGYLGMSDQVFTYTRGHALKKAAAFGGEVEAVG